MSSCKAHPVESFKLLTSALVQDVEKRSVGHVMGDDDGVRGWRCLTGPENRKNVWMREDPTDRWQKSVNNSIHSRCATIFLYEDLMLFKNAVCKGIFDAAKKNTQG